jgi:hypothetical protein
MKYIRKFNPLCSKLFQQPKPTPKDGVYYNNSAVGHSKLGTYTLEISKKAGLSTIYTNHSCRATTVHLLDAAQIPSRHIMTVTGHNAENSLQTYSGKTTEGTQNLMSEIISKKNQRKECATCIGKLGC